MEYPATHARVTLSVYEPDFEGFAPVGELTIEQFEALPEIEQPSPDQPNHFIVDLMSGENTIIADKWVSDEAIETLLGKPVSELISLGRQRLAQINDEFAEYCEQRGQE